MRLLRFRRLLLCVSSPSTDTSARQRCTTVCSEHRARKPGPRLRRLRTFNGQVLFHPLYFIVQSFFSFYF